MNIYKEAAKARVKNIIWSLLGFNLIWSVLAAATNVAALICTLVFLGPITAGMIIASIAAYRDEPVPFSLYFSGFKNFGKYFAANFLLGLYWMLWSVLLVIPGIIKCYSYALTWYLLADNPQLGANEAITKSRELMNGRKMDLFLLDLSFIGWHLLGILTLGLGYIYVTPYCILARTAFLEEVKKASGASHDTCGFTAHMPLQGKPITLG